MPAAELIARRVFVDYRPGCGIRVSPHFYTTDDEIDALLRGAGRLRGGCDRTRHGDAVP